jgi:hypothetical protein
MWEAKPRGALGEQLAKLNSVRADQTSQRGDGIPNR